MFGVPRWNWSYTRIKTTSSDDGEPKVIEGPAEKEIVMGRKARSLKLVIQQIIIAISGFAILAAIGIFALHATHHPAQHDRPVRLCGNSTAEALARGCTFDQLMWSWYPPSCPHYANDAFVKAEDWKYFLDPHGQRAIHRDNLTDALIGRWELWGQRGEHLTHCIYMLLSLGQILRDGTPYPDRLTKYEHLEHCSEILLEAIRKDDRWHSVETKVPEPSFDQHC